mgnify:CR=1 FL=1
MLGSGHGAPQDPTDTLHVSITSREALPGHEDRAIDSTSEQAVQEAGDTHLVEGPLKALTVNADNTLRKILRGSQPQTSITIIGTSLHRPRFYRTNGLKKWSDRIVMGGDLLQHL